jgi:hypothetical protein
MLNKKKTELASYAKKKSDLIITIRKDQPKRKKKKEKRKFLTNPRIITKSILSHVVEFNRPFAAAVHQQMTMAWVKLRTRDDFGQFLHIGRLDINNI